MSRRGALASVVDALAGWITGPQRMYDENWAFGVVVARFPEGTDALTVDLLDGVVEPPIDDPVLRSIVATWRDYLPWSLERHGIPAQFVRRATVRVTLDRTVVWRFGYHWLPRNGPPDAPRRNPFGCRVTIEDDRGRVRHASRDFMARSDAQVTDWFVRGLEAMQRARRKAWASEPGTGARSLPGVEEWLAARTAELERRLH